MNYKMSKKLEGIASGISDTPKMEPITAETCPECNYVVDYTIAQPICKNPDCDTHAISFER